MGKYGQVALRATALVTKRGYMSPPEAWKVAAREVFPDSPASQTKGCPKSAYLGLCEEGLVVGVPRGNYTNSRDNKAYALKAVRLLVREPALALQGPDVLWERVMDGERKTPNHQMDVVLALWNQGLIVGSRGASHSGPRPQVDAPVLPLSPTNPGRPPEPMADASPLFLVSCVSTKRAVRSRARDLYISPWFEKARKYVEANGDRWFILSAEHGLLHPDEEVEPYEKTLNEMNPTQRREWADRVLAKLRPLLMDVERVVVLAGERYREFLISELEALCPVIDIPMAGLGIGEQLSWLDANTRISA